MRNRTEKDILVALYLSNKTAVCGLDPDSRIVPAFFFQPHFHNIVYQMRVDSANRTVLEAKNYKEISQSPIFRNFKYIKTFTPLRRFTTSHGATVKFMYASVLASEKRGDKIKSVVSDAVSERILNRSFMIDPEDRLYKDSRLVRFEDGKLNPKAVFTALAAFLDLPYNEKTMSFCSEGGNPVCMWWNGGYAPGFSPAKVYTTYDEYVNNSERYFIEFFLRDAYAYYGYDFQYWDGTPVDEARVAGWIENFSTMDRYIRETWIGYFRKAEVYKDDKRLGKEEEARIQEQILENKIQSFRENRLKNAKILLEGLYFVNKNGQPLQMMPMLDLDPALLEQPLYH